MELIKQSPAAAGASDPAAIASAAVPPIQLALAAIAVLALESSAPAAERLFAGGAWAAHRFGARCEAASRPLFPARAREEQARAGFMFDSGRRGSGDFYVRLSRPARPGSSILLTVGSEPFLLAGSGVWARSRGGPQAGAIIAAARRYGGMRVEARDAGGRRFTDRYLLDGAATAIDSAAAGCAGKS